ncbi:hypothetical protein UC8_22080 [Roseimaritima ulvae]|uniref:Uncharacterized protein n=1 Tax=Roseimaritima ulvae TaxID=980254 RepID=A0A5B9R1V8_9BACT|nr:hypothetical protein UC8_22080 [Roseimaritima ulvae]
MEADDSGLPPEDVRAQMLKSGGRWGLDVTTEGPRRIEACKILHCDLGTIMDEVKPMKQRMPGIVYTGTRAEMEWLCRRLSQFEINSTVLPQNDGDHARSIDISKFATSIINNAKRR